MKNEFLNADAICFDFDSTVIKYEGIDKLAEIKNKYSEVSEITKKTMGENLSFRESLEQRLNLIKPNLNDLNPFVKSVSSDDLSDGVLELIKLLKLKGKEIFVISGGFEQMISPYLSFFNISNDNLFCNKLLFDEKGNYYDFDRSRPTSLDQGKIKVIKQLSEKFKNIIMIGDGSTDLDTQPYVSAFIGYGGNIIREKIKENANYYITDYSQIINTIN